MLSAALPALLSKPARGLADPFELTTRVAGATGAKAEIPALAEMADRKGGSRQLKEARRLQSMLIRQ
ncbi:hypothetical protein [Paractinoplanes deccanensis]|uniref:hypothetical protein n=1 Tax=Paractinoplanes deccanensis TaxID=113561 RepID=UPI0019415902|nr:hypothetical protein [Actinoplanes deccanensis]